MDHCCEMVVWGSEGATRTFQTDGPLPLTLGSGDLPVTNTYLIHMHDIGHWLSKEKGSIQSIQSHKFYVANTCVCVCVYFL